MSYNDLANYYQDMFFYTYRMKIMGIAEYESLIPYERDVIDMMIKQYNEEMEENARVQEAIEEAKARIY